MKQRAGSVLRLATPVKAWAQRFALVSLICAAFALMLLGKADTLVIERARSAISDAVAPILDAATRPVETVTDAIEDAQELMALREENVRLREQNARLLHWQTVAQRLEADNGTLRGLLHLAPEPSQRFVTARVIGDNGGAFVRSVLVSAGSREGVARGQAALTGEGLAGRVAQVGVRSARVLLVTDMNSRIPILVGAGRDRGVLAGDNSARPTIVYLGPRVAVKPGDLVVTSGHGGAFPSGLPVGTVASVGETGVRVTPFMDPDHMEYLRLVDYELPRVLLSASGGEGR